jgi:ribonuclease HI
MVHKMRLSELKEELERRGFNVSSFVKLKRPDLVSMLLTEVTKVSTVSSTKTNDDLDHGVTDKSTKSGGTNTNNISDGNVLSSANTEADGTSKRVGRLSVEHFPIHKVQFDPNTTYAISVRGVTVYGKNGSGVGLVLRECNNHTIVWQGQKYYSGYRSNFESDYTAIVLALRFALQSFHLKNVQVHIANVIIVNQIIGNVPVTKPTLQLLLGQVSQLLKENESSTSSVVFLAAESERLGPETALALDALNTKNSFNLNEENDHQLTVDPMIEILGLQNMTYDMKLPKKLEDDQQYTLKFKEFLKPGEVVINPNTTYTLRFDGGSRGNPGVAGAGMVLYDDQNREIWRGVKYLGRKMSNNLAEYTALNVGLSYALSMGIERIRCEGDSQLVIKQLNGVYQVKSDNLRGLFHETKTLIQKFTSCEVHHIRRELNSRADELANQGK